MVDLALDHQVATDLVENPLRSENEWLTPITVGKCNIKLNNMQVVRLSIVST
jgi:hypothetical protein